MLLTGKTTKLSKIMYTCLLYLESTRMSDWIGHIGTLLNGCDVNGYLEGIFHFLDIF